MQLPPTPTPMPPPDTSNIVDLDISLWYSAPTSVGFWNMFPPLMFFQFLIILVVLVAIVLLLINIAATVTTDE